MYTRFYDKNDPISAHTAKEMLPHADKIVLKRPISSLEILNGSAEYKEIERTFIKHSYIIYAKTNAEFRENTLYFPGWKILANGKEVPLNFRDKNNYGVINFDLPMGLYFIDLEFTDKKVRYYSKIVSGIFIIGSILILLTTFFKKNFYNISGYK